MPKKPKSNKPEILSRSLEFASYRMSVRLHAIHHKGDEPYIESKPWLELKGTVTEPVKGVKDVLVSLYPEDKPVVGTARPAACGAIIRARPNLEFVVTWPHLDFDRVWAMALGGKLTHGYFAFTKPHFNSGLVLSASFSSEMEE